MHFKDLLDDLGVSCAEHGTHHHTTEGWINIDCPFCSPNSQHYRLGYNLAGGYMSCWQCGSKRVGDVLCELTGKDWKEVKPLLSGITKELVYKPKHTGKLLMPKGVGDLLPIHKKYLKNRSFDPDYLSSFWGVQGIGLTPSLSWRLFIPIHHHGQIVSWTTRAIVDTVTRYINATEQQESMSAKGLLYGEDHVRHAVIVVEGPTDVWRIGPGAVATMGLGFSQAQITKLIKYPVRVIVFDNEPQAQRQAHKLCTLLSPFDGKTIKQELHAKDPGSASVEEIKELRERYLI